MKHLVNLDDELLKRAKASLGTITIRDTVNESLRIASESRRIELNEALDDLARLAVNLPIEDRSEAW